MNKLLEGFTLVSGALVASSASAAITLTDLQKVVDTSKFAFGYNTWAPGTTYSVSIDGGSTFYQVSRGNTSALLNGLTNRITQVADIAYDTKTINGTTYNNLPVVTLKQDVAFQVATGGTVVAGTNGAPNTVTGGTVAAEVTLQSGLQFNADPQINTPINVLNTTAGTQSFTLTIPLILSPALTPVVAPQTEVKSSLTGTLRNGATGAGTTTAIAPVSGTIVSTILFDGVNPVSAGVNVGNAQSFGGAGSLNNEVYTYLNQYNPGSGPALYSSGPVPASSFTTMLQTTTFTLTARDRATLTAFSEIVPIPEPSTYALMAAGLALVGTHARRRLPLR